MNGLANFLVSNRMAMLALTLLTTALAAFVSLDLKIYDDPNLWPPKDDPAVVLNGELQQKFGGANMVTIMLTRNDGGSVINADSLEAVKRITDELRRVHGVIPYAVRSLSSLSSRYLKGSNDVLDAGLLFDNPNRAPQTEEELARVRFGISNNAALKGSLVAHDESALIIQADFRTGLANVREGLSLPVTDPISIYRAVQDIVQRENNDLHRVTSAGSPILIGWVNSDGLPYILGAFLLVVAGIAIVLLFAFRSFVGVIPPLFVGIIASIWAFAMQRMFEGDVLHSSAALIAPFIILAVAASHSVLFIKRYLTDELRTAKNEEEGLRRTLIHMARPLVVVLCTDLMAFIVLSFVPFDNVRVLGQVTAFGLLAIVVIIPTFLVALLSIMPKAAVSKAASFAQKGRDSQSGLIYRMTAVVVRPLIYNKRAQYSVLFVSVALVLVSLSVWFPISVGNQDNVVNRFLGEEIKTGQNNTYAVHNFLTKSWEENELYLMEQEITERFGGVYTFSILATAENPGDVKTVETLLALDKLAAHMEAAEQVSSVSGLPFYIKIMNRFLNEDSDEAFEIPTQGRSQMAVNEALYFLTGSLPGSFDFVVDPDYKHTVMVAYVTDTSPDTVSALIERARAHIAENWDAVALGVQLELPAGNVGIADAFNRSIKKWMVLATAASAIASFFAAALMLRSIVGPLLLMFPLAMGIVVWMFMIHLIGIEFNSNVTAALAIASGVGIDAEVYLLYRFREEYPKDGDFHRALFDAFTLVREPLIFSFVALFAGCLAVSMVPLYVGYVGFSMALILLATFLLSFFAAPVVWSLVQPRFLIRGLAVKPNVKEYDFQDREAAAS